MACTLYVAWDGRLVGYDFGAGTRWRLPGLN